MRERLVPSTMRGRLAATLALMSLALVAGFGVLLVTTVRDRYEAGLASKLESEARLTAAALAPDGSAPDPAALAADVERMATSAGTRLLVFGPDGALLADSVGASPGADVTPGLSSGDAAVTRTRDGWMDVTVPASGGGAVVAMRPLSEVDSAVRAVELRVLAGAAAASVLATLSAFVIAGNITGPLETLRRHASLVSAGRLDAAVDPPGTQELGELARAFNTMTRRVRDLVEEEERERSRLEAIFANLGDGVVVVDAAQRVVAVNPTASRMLGTDPGQAIGRPFVVVVRDADLQRLLSDAFAGDAAVTATIDYARDGRVLDAAAQPVASGSERLGIVVMRDVSELKRLETVRREFVANVSHELRTPLASIRALVETLEAGAIDDPAVSRDFFGRVIGEVERLTALVDELLDLARLQSGRLTLHATEVSPASLIEGGVERLRAQSDRARLHLITEVPPGLPPVRVDRARIEQVLLNLVHNAIKFTPPGGTITVRAAREGDAIAVSVADTGSGIAPAELPRVFERFYKSDRARRSEGTGLGLAIAKHIVQAHGGAIRVESAPGVGSTFTFTLPVGGAAKDGARAAS